MPGGPDKDKIEEIRLKNRKGDPRTIKTPPSGIPKGPKPKPKPRPKGSNMQSYEPMGAGSRLIKAQKGDNLSTIAKRGGTTVKSIMNFNPNITNADKIREGQSIRVPAGTGMKKGGKVKGYKMGGALKTPTNKGLASLPTEVRNKMGFMKKGGKAKPYGMKKGGKPRGYGLARSRSK